MDNFGNAVPGYMAALQRMIKETDAAVREDLAKQGHYYGSPHYDSPAEAEAQHALGIGGGAGGWAEITPAENLRLFSLGSFRWGMGMMSLSMLDTIFDRRQRETERKREMARAWAEFTGAAE